MGVENTAGAVIMVDQLLFTTLLKALTVIVFVIAMKDVKEINF
jgi:hypothetical protein